MRLPSLQCFCRCSPGGSGAPCKESVRATVSQPVTTRPHDAHGAVPVSSTMSQAWDVPLGGERVEMPGHTDNRCTDYSQTGRALMKRQEKALKAKALR